MTTNRSRRLLALLLAASACAHGEAGGAPSAPDGASLYRRSCSSCHRLKAPGEHDARTWRSAVERFGTHLGPIERARIADYLSANARPLR